MESKKQTREEEKEMQKISYYEELKNKAELCRKAAFRTTGTIRKVWFRNATELEFKAANLPLIKASLPRGTK